MVRAIDGPPFDEPARVRVGEIIISRAHCLGGAAREPPTGTSPVSSPLESHQRASYGLLQGYAVTMADGPIGTKPEPRQQAGSVISIADRERRHEAARRLAERHNANLRPPPGATA